MTTTLEVPSPTMTATLGPGPKNLYQRLAAVRVALGGEIAKNGQAPDAMGRFKFIAWDDVAEKIGGFMADAGIALLPGVNECEITEAGTTANSKTIWRAKVTMGYRVLNIDSPEEFYEFGWVGVGDDTSDKSVQKAITSATKYALLKLFLLSGADDADASDVTSSAAPARRAPAQPPITAVADGERPFAEGDPCPYCAEKGGSGKFKIATGGRYRGSLQCTGKIDDVWQNHLAPVSASETEAAANAPDFDYEQPR